MIVSHSKRFIFVRTRKVASTSVEAFLEPFCGQEDIVTPFNQIDRALFPEMRPRNYRLPFYGPRTRALRIFGEMIGRPAIGHGGFYNHMPAKEIRRLVGDTVWNGFYKFSLERNPWDRQVSLYYWHYRNSDPKPSFDSFIRSPLRRKISPNFDTYSIDGKIAVDHVCRYENLRSDLAHVLEQVGIQADIELPMAKANHRSDRDWRKHYTAETRDIVASWYAREIEAFGYSF